MLTERSTHIGSQASDAKQVRRELILLVQRDLNVLRLEL
jgi:hypothetical protein